MYFITRTLCRRVAARQITSTASPLVPRKPFFSSSSSSSSSFCPDVSRVGPIQATSVLQVRGYTAAATMADTLPRLPILEAIAKHDPESTAVIHSLSRREFKYGELLGDVRRARDGMRTASGKADLNGERIAFLVENSYDYVVTLLAAMANKAIAVPMSPAFPAPELQYIINQSGACLLVSSNKFESRAKEVLATELESPPQHFGLAKHQGGGAHEKVDFEDGDVGSAGMMLYTSGTTNRPKGVLLPQSALHAQALSLQEAWSYAPSDHLLHVLPLHHIHGTVNGLLTPLLSGSTIEFLFPFNPDHVWKRFAAPFNTTNTDSESTKPKPITFFTTVPTVYSRLLATHSKLPQEIQEIARSAVSPENMRLSISGSAALPTPVKEAWKALSKGSILLERYGMTEVGMALSCGLPTADRIDASVGWPLPSVQARLYDVDNNQPLDPTSSQSGEIQLRGPTIFNSYFNNPSATKETFTPASPSDQDQTPWFKTGDIAIRKPHPHPSTTDAASPETPWASGSPFFILGRASADIIKTGGEKVSALEVEREILSIPKVAECAVVAVPSGKWGQKVGAVVVLDKEYFHAEGQPAKWSPMDMRRALKERLANYKIPQVLRVVDSIPRNAMGKINKKVLVNEVFKEEHSGDEL